MKETNNRLKLHKESVELGIVSSPSVNGENYGSSHGNSGNSSSNRNSHDRVASFLFIVVQGVLHNFLSFAFAFALLSLAGRTGKV
jgi:hypothetical protein